MAEMKSRSRTKSTRSQNTKRVHEIVTILRKYNVLKNLTTQSHPKQVREAFELLGPTFIKIGQMMSTRPDIVTPAFADELSKLQDDVTEDDFETVKRTIESNFHKKLNELFQDFTPKPIASASMGQVHLAHLPSGVRVAVKVQHPGIQQSIRADLNILSRLMRFIKWLPNSQVINPQEIFAQFKRAVENELDSGLEAENTEHFYHLNNQRGIFEVPKLYRDYCTAQVLTTEYMPGKSLKYYLKKIEHEEITDKRRYLAKALVENFMKQVFDDGFFHADPHPGNILLDENQSDFSEFGEDAWVQPFNKQTNLPAYRLVYLDFGMMGSLDSALISNLANVVMAVNSKDAYKIGNELLNICKVVGPLDKGKFFEELNEFIGPYYNTGLGSIDLEKMATQIIVLCRENYLQMDPDVTLLMKAFGTLEGVILQLDPNISMLAVARPFTRHYILRKVNFRNELEDRLLDSYQMLKDMPKVTSQLKNTLQQLDRGNLNIGIELKHRQQVMDRVETMVNHIAIALVLAGLIVGSSMLVQDQNRTSWISRLGIFGYILATVFIIGFTFSEFWRRFSRWRKRRRKP